MTTTSIDWGGIAARHGERIFRAARTFAPDDDAAWDCVQEALLFAVTSGDPARIERPVEWVCGVAANRARHALRSRGRFRAVLERLVRRRRAPAAAPAPEPGLADDLHAALGHLSPALRDAVVLRYFAGMSAAEIARACGVTESAAKMRVSRGLAKLRRILGATAVAVLIARRTATASPGALLAAATGGSGATVTAAGATAALAATAAKAKVALLAGIALLVAAPALLTVPGGSGPASPAPGTPPPPALPAPVSAAAAAPAPADDDGVPATPLAVAEEGSFRLRTVATGPDGATAPAPGVRLLLAPWPIVFDGAPGWPVGLRSARTGDDGEVALPFDGGQRLWIYVHPADGVYSLAAPMSRLDVTLPAAPAEPIPVPCARRGTAVGVVLAPEGAPVAGATVCFARAEPEPQTCPELGTATARTDAAGRFEIGGVPSGRSLVAVASRPPFAKAASAPFTLADGGCSDELVVRLREGASVAGRVADDTGTPVEGARITVTTGNTTRFTGTNVPALLPGETTTDADGRYELAGLEPGHYRVFAEKAGYLPTNRAGARAGAAGGDAPELVLRRGAPLAGVVVDEEGRPWAAAFVSLSGPDRDTWYAPARTDEEGRFRFDAVLPGPHTIRASAGGFRASEPVEVSLPRETAGRVVVPGGREIRGVALDRNGRGISHAVIDAWLSPERSTSLIAGEDGRFRLGGLPREGMVTVCVRSFDPYPDVTVPTATTGEIVLRPMARGSIAGIVLDPAGRPVARARVTATAADGSLRPRRGDDRGRGFSVRSDANGRFELPGLAATRFDLRAESRGLLPAAAEAVPLGTEEVLLRLGEGSVISGRVEFGGDFPEGWRYAVAEALEGEASGSTALASDGTFRITGLAPGRYALHLRLPACRWSAGEFEAGASGVTIRVPAWESLPLADLRRPVPEGRNSATWYGLWFRLDEAGVRDRSGLYEVLPGILSDPNGLPFADSAAALLLRIDTAEAKTMLVRFLEPGRLPVGALREVLPTLLDVDDPRLGPAAVRLFHHLVATGETSWVGMDPACALLARHGGEEGARILDDLLRRETGSPQATTAAAKALRHATRPDLLDSGLAWFDGQSGGEPMAKPAAGWIAAFGPAAREALLARALDREAPRLRRAAAAQALLADPGPGDVASLLEVVKAGRDEALIPTLLRHLPEVESVGADAAACAALRAAAISLLDADDAVVRLAVIRAIGSAGVYASDDIRRALAARLPRVEDRYERREIERILDRGKEQD